MIVALDWCSGICWSLVYAFATVQGFRKQTYCIPCLCICLNFSWEILVVTQRCLSGSYYELGFAAQVLWLLLDIGVLMTWMLFDRKKTFFVKIAVFAGAFVMMYCWAFWADMWAHSAFSINLLMSILFICRKTGVWSLKSVALLKMIGTAAATVLNGFLFQDAVILWIGGLILILDVYYFFGLCFRPEGATNER